MPHINILIRLFVIMGAIILCYNYPSDCSSEFLGFEHLKENTSRSLYLCFFVALVWVDRAALFIILIEALLIICNFYTGYHLDDGGGIFNKHYSTLQEVAYWLELVIMSTFIIIEWRKRGERRYLNFHSHLFHRRATDNHGEDN